MKIVVLTTQTPHHTYFVQEVVKRFPVELVLLERGHVNPPFPTSHAFEAKRDEYENAVFFGGKERRISEFAPVAEVDSANGKEALGSLDAIVPDVIISFGTGKISKELIARCSDGIINLHGGDPEEYRGLDSHLWAIYHKDFKNLITTLHRLNERLDDGQIIARLPVPLKRDMKIFELRRYNTQVCVDLTLAALATYQRDGKFTAQRQRKQGRYYSFMPAVLKQICQEYFERYTATL